MGERERERERGRKYSSPGRRAGREGTAGYARYAAVRGDVCGTGGRGAARRRRRGGGVWERGRWRESWSMKKMLFWVPVKEVTGRGNAIGWAVLTLVKKGLWGLVKTSFGSGQGCRWKFVEPAKKGLLILGEAQERKRESERQRRRQRHRDRDTQRDREMERDGGRGSGQRRTV